MQVQGSKFHHKLGGTDMTDTEKLDSILQELKGFNGSPGLCRRVTNLEWMVRGLCVVGGGSVITAIITKLTGS